MYLHYCILIDLLRMAKDENEDILNILLSVMLPPPPPPTPPPPLPSPTLPSPPPSYIYI